MDNGITDDAILQTFIGEIWMTILTGAPSGDRLYLVIFYCFLIFQGRRFSLTKWGLYYSFILSAPSSDGLDVQGKPRAFYTSKHVTHCSKHHEGQYYTKIEQATIHWPPSNVNWKMWRNKVCLQAIIVDMKI